MNAPTLMPQSQLAECLNVSPRTLERWRVEGGGPAFVKAGRRVLYRTTDVESWLAGSVRQSTSDLGGRYA